MRSVCILSVLLLLVSCSNYSARHITSKVYFIPVLHQLHKVNHSYSYDHLQSIIREISPDVILTEIRPEDMQKDSTYISANYPYEMYMVKKWFPEIATEGFDWLGKDLEGRPVPGNYWKDSSWVKKLQRNLQKDSFFLKKALSCYENNSIRDSILRYASLNEIIKGEDKKIVLKQYTCFENVSRGTPYHRLSQFYRERNDSILANIKRSVNKHAGKKILIITGDDHYQILRDEISHEEL